MYTATSNEYVENESKLKLFIVIACFLFINLQYFPSMNIIIHNGSF